MADAAADPRGKRRGLTGDGHAVYDKVVGRTVTKEATPLDPGLVDDGTTWKLVTEDKE